MRRPVYTRGDTMLSEARAHARRLGDHITVSRRVHSLYWPPSGGEPIIGESQTPNPTTPASENSNARSVSQTGTLEISAPSGKTVRPKPKATSLSPPGLW